MDSCSNRELSCPKRNGTSTGVSFEPLRCLAIDTAAHQDGSVLSPAAIYVEELVKIKSMGHSRVKMGQPVQGCGIEHVVTAWSPNNEGVLCHGRPLHLSFLELRR